MEKCLLEPRLETITEGTRVSLMFQVQLRLDHSLIGKTEIFGQRIHIAILLGTQEKFSCFDAIVQKQGSQTWLHADYHTKVIPHSPSTLTQPFRVVETCAGIGAGGLGLHSLGFETVCYNDINPVYCNWLESRTTIPVVQGDLTQHSTIVAVSEAAGEVDVLMSGVACQPFSSLGDQRQQADPRARTFPGSLFMGFHLQAKWILLECTKEARFSPWTQQLLTEFCHETGYQRNQQILDLHHMWAGMRTRWWCVLTHPSLPANEIPTMPKLNFTRSLFHVIPRPLAMPDDQTNQLTLDSEEFNGFNDHVKGYYKYLVDFTKLMPTATHSWGSQLKKCECGCRTSGFHPKRLQEKGLYGALCHLDGQVFTTADQHPKLRHLHPQEVSLLSGLPPLHVAPGPGSSLRLDLSGVGQMASPLQSTWVMSHAAQALIDQGANIQSKAPPHRNVGYDSSVGNRTRPSVAA